MLKPGGYKCVCGRCEFKSDKRELIARGKKTLFILGNETGKIINKFIVDDCLLRSKRREQKCDYLFEVENEKVVYLVECKGSDILKAISQIESTMEILKADLSNYMIKARIVPTRVYSPDIKTEKYKKLRARLNGELKIKNTRFDEKI